MTERLEGKVDKGWGYELIFATNDKYCGKIIVFEKAGAKTSMTFHKEKDKTWFVNNGKLLLRWIDTNTATLYSQELNPGDVWRNPSLQPHQLEAIEDNSSITEVSTPDSVEDYFRIIPGDSQQPKQETDNDE